MNVPTVPSGWNTQPLSGSLIVLLFVIPLLLSFTRWWGRKDHFLSQLPSPPHRLGKASWLWGHERLIFEHEACEMYSDWARAVGMVYTIKSALFRRDAIVIADNAAVQHIFKNSYSYVKAPAFIPLIEKLLGKGVVWAEGDEHKYQRRLLAPAFTLDAIKGMTDDIVRCVQNLVIRISKDIKSQSPEKVLNIVPYTSGCTLDMIGLVAFGHDFHGGESMEAKEISASWHQDVVLGHTFGGFLAPILLSAFPWIAKLPIPALQTEGAAKIITFKLAGRLVKENRFDNGNKDILSLLKRSQHTLSDNQLLANISTFIMVGHETSAATINFTLLQLARHPRVQAKLRIEIQGVVSDFDSIEKLAYLDAVVREGLRLHPSAPRTERVALEDDVIPLSRPVRISNGGTITSLPIKAGQVFHIPFTLLNTNSEVWGPDSHEFKPERWLMPGGVPSRSDLPQGPWANIASFCDGPRGCLGWRLGVLELKTTIMLLIRSFEFNDSGADIRQFISPTLQPFVNGEGGQLPLRVSLVAEHHD